MSIPEQPRDFREPKYYAVKRHLLEIIGTLSPGSPVPTERLLMAQLGTSRTTVRQALAELVGEGRLVRRQGSGTYVAEPKVSWPLRMTSFTEQANATGRAASTELIDARRDRATDEIAERLRLQPGAPVHSIERLRLVDDTPMALETSHLSATRFPGLAKHLRRSDSLYRVLRDEYGVVPVSAEETIETASATPREAELLNTETGAPILMLSRHSFDADGEPVEWVRSWYRGDRYRFVTRLTTD
ncbi:MAG: GntR family transcriptional regulator, nutrient-sensing system regulator [Pseudonocardiales bacterium]|nr:GntR family transcriptional regulator, nutrient-sensing system regulator [Pseudonocardiales bacterium]